MEILGKRPGRFPSIGAAYNYNVPSLPTRLSILLHLKISSLYAALYVNMLTELGYVTSLDVSGWQQFGKPEIFAPHVMICPLACCNGHRRPNNIKSI